MTSVWFKMQQMAEVEDIPLDKKKIRYWAHVRDAIASRYIDPGVGLGGVSLFLQDNTTRLDLTQSVDWTNACFQDPNQCLFVRIGPGVRGTPYNRYFAWKCFIVCETLNLLI
jgi:hypothetical protein